MAAARTSRKTLAGATVASLAAHLLVFALLALGTRSLPSAEPPRAFDVDLVRPLVKTRPERATPTVLTARKPSPAAPRVAAKVVTPPESVAPFVVPPPLAEAKPSEPPAEDPVQAAARAAVREGFGCDRKLRFRLSAAELAACDRHDRQYAARKGQGPGASASLDTDGRFIKPNPDDPYLTRMPQKGCKPRVGGAGGDGTSDDHFVPGITCVFKF